MESSTLSPYFKNLAVEFELNSTETNEIVLTNSLYAKTSLNNIHGIRNFFGKCADIITHYSFGILGQSHWQKSEDIILRHTVEKLHINCLNHLEKRNGKTTFQSIAEKVSHVVSQNALQSVHEETSGSVTILNSLINETSIKEMMNFILEKIEPFNTNIPLAITNTQIDNLMHNLVKNLHLQIIFSNVPEAAKENKNLENRFDLLTRLTAFYQDNVLIISKDNLERFKTEYSTDHFHLTSPGYSSTEQTSDEKGYLIFFTTQKKIIPEEAKQKLDYYSSYKFPAKAESIYPSIVTF